MHGLDYYRMLFVLGLRNIFTHKLKSAVVGFLMFFGTALVVVGTALLDSVEDSMSKSITSSLAGHLQVYSAKAKDELALFGGMMMGAEDIGRIGDFEKLKQVATGVKNVKAVMPMGIDIANVTGGNEVDRLAATLREAAVANDQERIAVLRTQLLQLADVLEKEFSARLAITADAEKLNADLEALKKLRSDEFWAELPKEPELSVQFVETKIAPLVTEGLLIYLRYVGTDLDNFRNHFERFEIVKGEPVPKGHRGFLFADKFYEDQIKHKVARDFDKIHRMVVEEGKTIADDKLLQTLVPQNARQYRRILFQLDPEEAAQLKQQLAAMFPRTGTTAELTLEQLIENFLLVDDSNVRERYAYFYEKIAPLIELYQVRVGDVMTVRAFTRSGYLKAVNVKVYGTFNFRGLERSDLAAAANLMDIMTFRDLYGLMSDARREELAQIKAAVGVAEVKRENAEQALFGGGEPDALVGTAEGAGFDEFAGVDLRGEQERMQDLLKQTFDQQAIDRGVALNAAVILEDPERLAETQAALDAALKEAGLEMQVVDWQTASGIVGQFIIVIRMVLYIAIGIIFLVALVIINNTMVMATMERTTEIGTMRAMGAQRTSIMVMFLYETVVLGLIAGGAGALAGAGLVSWLGQVGIPAGTQDVLIFIFGGPRLRPFFGADNLIIGLISIFVVSLISTLYPARLATRIQPVVAMQGKD